MRGENDFSESTLNSYAKTEEAIPSPQQCDHAF